MDSDSCFLLCRACPLSGLSRPSSSPLSSVGLGTLPLRGRSPAQGAVPGLGSLSTFVTGIEVPPAPLPPWASPVWKLSQAVLPHLSFLPRGLSIQAPPVTFPIFLPCQSPPSFPADLEQAFGISCLELCSRLRADLLSI